VSNGWPLVPMEDIFEIARGGSPRPIDSFLTDDPDGVNWVMISDATESGKYINSTKKRIREEGVKRSRVVQPGDFLLTNSMSFGRPYIMNTSGCIHDGWLVLSPRHENVSPDFFYYLLGSDFVYAEFVRRAAGATVKNLNIDLVKGVQVPLPPMEEQRRIAEVLDRAEALRTKRRAVLAQLDTLTQAIFLSLFGDPHRNQNDWPRRPMSELFAVPPIFGSMVPPVGERRGWLALRVGNIQDWTLDLHNRKYVDLPAEAAERHSVKEGDLLLARAIASEEHLGKCIVADPGEERWAFDSHLMRLRFDRKQAEPEFIRHLFMTPGGRRLFLGASRKSTVQFNINTKEISALRIPVPPFTLQQEFARRIALVERLKATYCASLAKLDILFAVLQHRAFRGEL
jgi:type I restriction enzyme S subunit